MIRYHADFRSARDVQITVETPVVAVPAMIHTAATARFTNNNDWDLIVGSRTGLHHYYLSGHTRKSLVQCDSQIFSHTSTPNLKPCQNFGTRFLHTTISIEHTVMVVLLQNASY